MESKATGENKNTEGSPCLLEDVGSPRYSFWDLFGMFFLTCLNMGSGDAEIGIVGMVPITDNRVIPKK